MKRIIMALAIVFSLTPAAFGGEEKVKRQVLDAFKAEFADAQNVTWIAGINYYRATFNSNGAYMYAYYNSKAELMGVVRNISIIELPMYLQNNLKNRYADYWITDLFELNNDEGTSYYITIQNADRRITLESKDHSGWSLYR